MQIFEELARDDCDDLQTIDAFVDEREDLEADLQRPLPVEARGVEALARPRGARSVAGRMDPFK